MTNNTEMDFMDIMRIELQCPVRKLRPMREFNPVQVTRRCPCCGVYKQQYIPRMGWCVVK